MRYLPLIAILLAGCAHSQQPTAEQVKDTGAVASCVANHWGEDWTQLIKNCAGESIDLFYDIVADSERSAAKQAADGGQPMRKASSYYAKQLPITSRLQRKDGG